MCLQTKKIIKNIDVIFMEDDMSVGNALEMRQSGRNEGRTAVVVDEHSKSTSCDDGDEREDQVKDHLIANEDAIKISAENDDRVGRFGKNGKYHKRE